MPIFDCVYYRYFITVHVMQLYILYYRLTFILNFWTNNFFIKCRFIQLDKKKKNVIPGFLVWYYIIEVIGVIGNISEYLNRFVY